MSKLVMIDSQLIVWGIKGQSASTQAHKIAPAQRFVDWLDEEHCKILLPVPQMVELLSCVPVNEQQAIRDLFGKRFRPVDFDILAGEKCAELIYKSLNSSDLIKYRDEHKVTKNKLKFDCMLVAIAITNRVKKIYSEDPDIKRFANGQIIVEAPPFIPEQIKFDFGSDSQPNYRMVALRNNDSV